MPGTGGGGQASSRAAAAAAAERINPAAYEPLSTRDFALIARDSSSAQGCKIVQNGSAARTRAQELLTDAVTLLRDSLPRRRDQAERSAQPSGLSPPQSHNQGNRRRDALGGRSSVRDARRVRRAEARPRELFDEGLVCVIAIAIE